MIKKARNSRLFSKTITTNNQSGFTLLELTFVILISGIIIVTLFGLFEYRSVVTNEKMDRQMDRLLFGMSEYFRVYGHYPCPANPNLPITNPDYGVSVYVGNNPQITPPVASLAKSCDAAGAVGATAFSGDIPVKALNFVLGCTSMSPGDAADAGAVNTRAGMDNANDDTANAIQDSLRTTRSYMVATDTNISGTHIDYCIPDEMGVDVYGTKLRYIVSARSVIPFNAASPATSYVFNGGAIDLIDQSGNSASATNAHFAIISYGADRKGGFTKFGAATPVVCGVGSVADDENCDDDATIMITETYQLGNNNNATHFDDRVEFTIFGRNQEFEPWTPMVDASGNRHTILMPSANSPVRIGGAGMNFTSSTRLVVGGGVNVDGANLIAGQNVETNANVDVNVDATAAGGFEATEYCYTTSPFPCSPCNPPPLPASCP